MIGSIIGGVASLGSAIYGAIKSSQENERARKLIQQERDENRRWYNAKMAEDFTQRADSQAVLKKQREFLEEQYKSSAARNVVAGGSDESLALQQEAANKAMSETMTDLAAAGAEHKDAVEQQYREHDAQINQQQAQMHSQQGAAVAQAAGQAVSTGLNMIGQNFKPGTNTTSPSTEPLKSPAKVNDAADAMKRLQQSQGKLNVNFGR